MFTTTDRGRSNSRRSGRTGHVVYGLAVVAAFLPARRRASRSCSCARARRVRARARSGGQTRQTRALLGRRTEWRVLDTSRGHQMVESPAGARSSVPSDPSTTTPQFTDIVPIVSTCHYYSRSSSFHSRTAAATAGVASSQPHRVATRQYAGAVNLTSAGRGHLCGHPCIVGHTGRRRIERLPRYIKAARRREFRGTRRVT